MYVGINAGLEELKFQSGKVELKLWRDLRFDRNTFIRSVKLIY